MGLFEMFVYDMARGKPKRKRLSRGQRRRAAKKQAKRDVEYQRHYAKARAKAQGRRQSTNPFDGLSDDDARQLLEERTAGIRTRFQP